MELIELVRRAKTGEAEAQSALYEASYKRVYYGWQWSHLQNTIV